MDFSPINKIVEDIEQESFVLKATLENVYTAENKYSPFLVFYNNPKNKSIAVATQDHDSFSQRMKSVAEALHLYPALQASAVTITFVSKINIEDNDFSLFNMFILSQEYAWLIHYPFTVKDNELIWHDDFNNIYEVDKYEFDEIGKELVSMFYHFINLPVSAFSVAEILSYLSTTSASIHQFEQKYEYINFQTEQ